MGAALELSSCAPTGAGGGPAPSRPGGVSPCWRGGQVCIDAGGLDLLGSQHNIVVDDERRAVCPLVLGLVSCSARIQTFVWAYYPLHAAHNMCSTSARPPAPAGRAVVRALSLPTPRVCTQVHECCLLEV